MTGRKAQLFFRFMKLGLFTIGGGYAMVPLIEREVVERCSWMKRDEYYRTLLLTQSLPGAIAVNTAMVVGMRLEGAMGGLLSALGVLLPSFLIIVTVAMGFTVLRVNPVVQAVFRGVRPTVVALIAVAGVRFLRQRPEVFTYVLAAVGFGVLLFLRVSPFLLVVAFIGVGILSACLRRRFGSKGLGGRPPSRERD